MARRRGRGLGVRGGARVTALVGWVVPWWAGLQVWTGGLQQQWTNIVGLGYFRVVRVFRVPWPNTRTTRTNFGYRGLEPGLGFGFFGLGFFGFGLGFFEFGLRVSGFLPSHNNGRGG